jgi:hypothetical protein
VTKLRERTAKEISQRDFIIQPSVATTTEGLRWVDEFKLNKPQRGLNHFSGNGGATRVGVENNFVETIIQGSSFLATAGLSAGIPLGFSNGTPERRRLGLLIFHRREHKEHKGKNLCDLCGFCG